MSVSHCVCETKHIIFYKMIVFFYSEPGVIKFFYPNFSPTSLFLG